MIQTNCLAENGDTGAGGQGKGESVLTKPEEQ